MLGPHPFDLGNYALIVSRLGADAAVAWHAKHLAVGERRILGEVVGDDVIILAFTGLQLGLAMLALAAATEEGLSADLIGELLPLHARLHQNSHDLRRFFWFSAISRRNCSVISSRLARYWMVEVLA